MFYIAKVCRAKRRNAKTDIFGLRNERYAIILLPYEGKVILMIFSGVPADCLNSFFDLIFSLIF